MADISDVEIAFAALVANVLYPAGTGGQSGYAKTGSWDMAAAYGAQGGIANSIAGLPVRIYRGWATAQQLDIDSRAGIAHLTVFHGGDMGRIEIGRLNGTETQAGPTPTITATVSGNVVTLGGTVTADNLVGLLVDRQPYVYRVQANDTLSSIGQTLAAMIVGQQIVLENGSQITDDFGSPLILGESVALTIGAGIVTLTIGATLTIIARTASLGLSQRRVRQQTNRLKLTCWAPTPEARDAICGQLDAQLADVRWLQLADQKARLLWNGTYSDDVSSKATLWRRDLYYHATYWTTLTTSVPGMLFDISNVTVNGAESTIFG